MIAGNKEIALMTNLLSAYNEALDNSRMSEETARTSIEEKYNVVFTDLVGDRYTNIIPA